MHDFNDVCNVYSKDCDFYLRNYCKKGISYWLFVVREMHFSKNAMAKFPSFLNATLTLTALKSWNLARRKNMYGGKGGIFEISIP